MSLEIGWFSFDGPYEEANELKPEAGVFAVLAEIDGKYDMLDVDQGEELRSSVEGHERKGCWEEHAKGPLRYVAYYLPSDEAAAAREEMVKEIRMQYKMACAPDQTPEHGWWRPEDQ